MLYARPKNTRLTLSTKHLSIACELVTAKLHSKALLKVL